MTEKKYLCKIYCCDALYYLRSLDDSSADMVLTDPMNTKDPEFNAEWLKEAYRVLREGKVLCSFCTPSTLDAFIEQAKSAGFSHLVTLYWKNKMMERKEPCIIMLKGNHEYEPVVGDLEWEVEPVSEFPAEAQKSLGMIKKLIEAYTKEGDLVIDFFLGSGTTALACKETGRDFKGCELNLAFCEIARKRLGFENLYTTGL